MNRLVKFIKKTVFFLIKYLAEILQIIFYL